MNRSPSYIHYRVQWQVLGPESPGQRFEREKFQQFFEALNASREFGGYDDFSYRPDLCLLAKSRGSAPKESGQAFSKVEYANDSLSIVEEWSDLSTDEFCQKLKVVLDRWFECFPQTMAVVQNGCVRALMDPVHFDDSRRFLGDAILHLASAFGKRMVGPLEKVGFTFGCQRNVGANPITLECSTSSWRDNRSVWIEVRTVAPLRTPLNAAGHDQAEAIFSRSTSFLETELHPLLLDYDQKNQAPGTGEKS